MTQMRIPVAKPLIGEEEITAVSEVLRSGMLAEGPRVAEFERRFAEYQGAKHALAVSNGTLAIYAALKAAGVGLGDKVIVPDFTFAATVNAVLALHAEPVLVDIDSRTYTMSVSSLEDAIRGGIRPKVVMPVHLYGYPADIPKIFEICRGVGASLVEDAAQAHGASIDEIPVGTVGTGCFSLYPTKNMTTSEGGVVTTNDDKFAEWAYLAGHHGTPKGQRYVHVTDGLNLRMTEIAAAIGLIQLGKIEAWTACRVRNAHSLSQGLGQIDGVVVPYTQSGYQHVYHQYTVRIKERENLSRDRVQQLLAGRGIASAVHYPSALHEQPAYTDLQRFSGEVAEQAGKEVLCLPVGPWVSEKDTQEIVGAFKEIFESVLV